MAPPAGTGKEFLNSAEAQIYADGQKIDPRTAAQRLDLMDDMGALDEKMTAVAGERYAGSWIDNEDFGFVFQLSGAGEIPSRLLDLAREAPFPTSVETTDKPSAGDIARFRDAHDDLLTDLVTNLQGIGDDVHTGQIVLDRHGDSDSTRYLTVTDPDSGLVIVVRVETGTAVASDGSAPIDSNLSTTGPR
ncbi:hypothetical protein D1871_01345 [Nakamurella silvestris]|nr:hypothetical protein D1871_01345 [Nakamurella silvestris]